MGDIVRTMDINQFLLSLLSALSTLEFVKKVDFRTKVFVLKGRVILKKNRFLQVYFNELTGTTAFTLIEQEKRIWGIDFDNMRGWHLHSLDNSEGQEKYIHNNTTLAINNGHNQTGVVYTNRQELGLILFFNRFMVVECIIGVVVYLLNH
ncbi:hypothetical protein ES705_26762 [subsurface metagenome]